MPRIEYKPMKILRHEYSNGMVMHQPLEKAKATIVIEDKIYEKMARRKQHQDSRTNRRTV